MTENENVNNQDDALKDTVNPDMEGSQETVEEQPKQEENVEAEKAKGDNVSEKKSKRFKIRHAQEKALEEEKAKYAELNDKYLRLFSEFDNFRKRTAKEKEQMFSMGEKSVIEKMLPVIDNFERGLAAVPEADKENPLASGMEMIYKQLVKQLEDLGVKPIEAVGKEFDPNFHNAVMQVESEEYESGVVAQEFLKGYMYHDTVIRHSMVGVVQ